MPATGPDAYTVRCDSKKTISQLFKYTALSPNHQPSNLNQVARVPNHPLRGVVKTPARLGRHPYQPQRPHHPSLLNSIRLRYKQLLTPDNARRYESIVPLLRDRCSALRARRGHGSVSSSNKYTTQHNPKGKPCVPRAFRARRTSPTTVLTGYVKSHHNCKGGPYRSSKVLRTSLHHVTLGTGAPI